MNPRKPGVPKTKLAEVISERGLMQIDVAHATEIDKQTLNSYVQGKREPSLKNARKLSRYFKMSIEELFPG